MYDEWTKPKAILTYKIVSGPQLPAGDGTKRIFSFDVKNDGKIKLTNVVANIRFSKSSIQGASLLNTMGLDVSSAKSENSRTFSISNMFPGDNLNASILTVTNGDSLEPIISLRSSETIGVQKPDLQASNQPATNSLWGDFLTPIAVFFAMGAYTVFLISTRKSGSVSRILVRAEDAPQREDIVGTISIMTGFRDLIQSFVYDRRVISYINFSDLVSYKGRSGDDSTRNTCIKALKAIALSPWIHSESLTAIENNISELDPAFSNDQLQQLKETREKIKHNSDFRDEIQKIFDS